MFSNLLTQVRKHLRTKSFHCSVREKIITSTLQIIFEIKQISISHTFVREKDFFALTSHV